MSLYTKLHGTTTDAFKIGLKNERITLTGTTTENGSAILLNRDGEKYTAQSTVFFTAYIIGVGSSSVASYEIKGCHISESTNITGQVVTTYIDSSNFTEPSIEFNSAGELTVQCTGIIGDSINWTASIDFVMV